MECDNKVCYLCNNIVDEDHKCYQCKICLILFTNPSEAKINYHITNCEKCSFWYCRKCYNHHKCIKRTRFDRVLDCYTTHPEPKVLDKTNKKVKTNGYSSYMNNINTYSEEDVDSNDDSNSNDNILEQGRNSNIENIKRLKSKYPDVNWNDWLTGDRERQKFLTDLVLTLDNYCPFYPLSKNIDRHWWLKISETMQNTFVICITITTKHCDECDKLIRKINCLRWKFFPDHNKSVNSDVYFGTIEQFCSYWNNKSDH